MRWIGIVCVALSLGGCSTYSLETLRHTELTGDAYHVALAKEYRDFSEVKEKKYNWSASWHFADKGLLAAYGRDVAPEALEDWNIPEAARAELTGARAALVQALATPAVMAQPQAAADAMVSFDCWVEQQDANWQTQEIDRCRNGFYAAMQQLTGKLPDYVDTHPPLVVADSYIAYFGWNDARLSVEAKALAASMAEEFSAQQDYHIVINGHTDTSGPEPYNMRLSRERAEQFRQALVAHGIPRARISLFAFGETDPKVPTGDGVRESINRRVEIFMNDSQ